MGHVIEAAKSGRARCRKCREAIAKGELRFGEEIPNTFADDGRMSYRWYHLMCGARACPKEMEEALAEYEGDVENRAELEREIDAAKRKQKPKTFPYAELAPSGRSKCLLCGEKIGKGELRVAVEREVDTGSFVTTSAGYLHPGCAAEHQGMSSGDLLSAIKVNTLSLSEETLEQLAGQL
jgi:hypothetical protein